MSDEHSDAAFSGAKAVDGNDATRWATNWGVTTARLVVDLDGSQTFNRIVVKEPEQASLQRVTGYTVEFWDGAAWVSLHTGTSIGENRSVTFSAVTGSRVRLSITGASDPPTIAEFQVWNDELRLSAGFSSATYSATEGSTASVTVNLSADPERTVVIPITATGQGGASSGDYSGVPASVTFNSGETTTSFTFTAVDDTDYDSGESVQLGIGSPLPAGVSAGTQATAVVSINDNEATLISNTSGRGVLSLNNYVRQSFTTGAVDVSLTEVRVKFDPHASATSASVKIRKHSDDSSVATLTAPSTIGTGEGYLSFAAPAATTLDANTRYWIIVHEGIPSSSKKPLELVVDSSPTAASDWTMHRDLEKSSSDSSGWNSTGVTSATLNFELKGTVSYPDVVVSFPAGTYTAAEGSTASVTVDLSADPKRTVVIPITAAGQNGATSGDFTVPGSVTFHSGETSKTIEVAAVDDTVDDDGESVKLGLGSPLPAWVTASTDEARDSATVSITDNTDNPDVSVRFGSATYSATEGSSVSVTVDVSADPGRTVVIPITAAGQGGASSGDYSGGPGQRDLQQRRTSRRAFSFTAVDRHRRRRRRVAAAGIRLTAARGGDRELPGRGCGVDQRRRPTRPASVSVSFGSATYSAAEGSTT